MPQVGDPISTYWDSLQVELKMPQGAGCPTVGNASSPVQDKFERCLGKVPQEVPPRPTPETPRCVPLGWDTPDPSPCSHAPIDVMNRLCLIFSRRKRERFPLLSLPPQVYYANATVTERQMLNSKKAAFARLSATSWHFSGSRGSQQIITHSQDARIYVLLANTMHNN